MSCSGRNFGLKSRGTNSEGERGALGPRGERGGEWEEVSPSSSDYGVRGSAPAENDFTVI